MTDTALTAFPPTRTAALERLRDFVPHAGRTYADRRNFDLPDQGHPGVSRLSPYLRHRLLTEEEVLSAVLARHSPQAAEKFVQEVFWRAYWKGWLEMRPAIWSDYRSGLKAARNRLATESGLRAGWEAACAGQTGIDGFDAWAQELTTTGYMHNHARMWFASIWIFTLGLPWELGADFFLRHLLDGDAASNTLGWRWVAGLQTRGKHYVARPSNIAKYTEGRHNPEGQIAGDAGPLDGPDHPPRSAPPASVAPRAGLDTVMVLTDDDLSPGYLFADGVQVTGHSVLTGVSERSPLAVADHVHAFTRAAVDDCRARYADRLGDAGPVRDGADGVPAIVDWAADRGAGQIVLPYVPVGPARMLTDHLAHKAQARGIHVVAVPRPYDLRAWPHATHGFFRFKEKIPKLLGAIKGLNPV